MTVVIGVDPHKRTHTAVVIDRDEIPLATLQVRAGRTQLEELLAWSAGFDDRVWAIESANGLGYLLGQQLVGAGERVLDVPATLSARVRVLATSRSNKNDPNDALSVAIAARHVPRVTEVQAADHPVVLRLVVKRHTDWAGCGTECVPAPRTAVRARRGRNQQGNHAEQGATVARHTHADHSGRTHPPSARPGSRRGPAAPRHAAARSRRRVEEAVAASGTSLTDIFGIGPIVAAMIIGHTRDVARFASRDRFAAYCGTAPFAFESGGRSIHRLSLAATGR